VQGRGEGELGVSIMLALLHGMKEKDREECVHMLSFNMLSLNMSSSNMLSLTMLSLTLLSLTMLSLVQGKGQGEVNLCIMLSLLHERKRTGRSGSYEPCYHFMVQTHSPSQTLMDAKQEEEDTQPVEAAASKLLKHDQAELQHYHTSVRIHQFLLKLTSHVLINLMNDFRYYDQYSMSYNTV
jgi:hypothetical protein